MKLTLAVNFGSVSTKLSRICMEMKSVLEKEII